MTLELAIILLYIAAQIGIGAWLFRRIKTDNDYFLAGRTLGIMLCSVSVFATWFGAETCIGSSGAVYADGLSGSRVDPLGYTICLLGMGLLFATRLYLTGATTLADYHRQRFGAVVERFSAIVLIPSSLIWAAAQIRALGQILSVASQIDPVSGMVIAALIVTIYTVLGGLLADVVTDLVQGIVIVAGLLTLLVVAIGSLGGLSSALSMIEPSQLVLFRPLAEESLLMQLDGWLVPICGSMVAQELIARTMAARSAVIAKRSVLTASAIYLLVGSIPILLGLIGPHVLPNLTDAEQFLPSLARELLPPVAFALFSGAMISAILSTVDSALLAVGSLAAHNIIPAIHRTITESGKVMTARISVVTAGIAALVIALFSGSIYELVETATGWGTGAILVITSFGLFTAFGNGKAALAALFAGTGSYLVTAYIVEIDAPFAMTIGVSLAAYLVWGCADRQPDRQLQRT